MNPRRRRLLPILLLLFSVVAIPSIGCGGGGGGSDGGVVTPTLQAVFTESNLVQLADRVKLLQGSASGTNVTVQVVLFGPSTSSDIYGWAFDVVISNPAVVEFVAASASAGTTLTPCPGNNLALQANQQTAGGVTSVVVGLTKLGNCAGNGVPAGNNVVVSLTFKVKAAGTSTLTFGGSPSPLAVDSNLAPIGSIAFDPGAATLQGVQQ
jgi:hypothetical protein